MKFTTKFFIGDRVKLSDGGKPFRIGQIRIQTLGCANELVLIEYRSVGHPHGNTLAEIYGCWCAEKYLLLVDSTHRKVA